MSVSAVGSSPAVSSFPSSAPSSAPTSSSAVNQEELDTELMGYVNDPNDRGINEFLEKGANPFGVVDGHVIIEEILFNPSCRINVKAIFAYKNGKFIEEARQSGIYKHLLFWTLKYMDPGNPHDISGKLETAKLLLSYFPDLLNMQDQEGNTVLHHVAKRQEIFSWMFFLALDGIDTAKQNNKGESPLECLPKPPRCLPEEYEGIFKRIFKDVTVNGDDAFRLNRKAELKATYDLFISGYQKDIQEVENALKNRANPFCEINDQHEQLIDLFLNNLSNFNEVLVTILKYNQWEVNSAERKKIAQKFYCAISPSACSSQLIEVLLKKYPEIFDIQDARGSLLDILVSKRGKEFFQNFSSQTLELMSKKMTPDNYAMLLKSSNVALPNKPANNIVVDEKSATTMEVEDREIVNQPVVNSEGTQSTTQKKNPFVVFVLILILVIFLIWLLWRKDF